MGYKIVIIEDDPISAGTLTMQLSEKGYDVLGATDCMDEFLSIINNAQPDLIIADIDLNTENYDGIDLANTANERHQIPVIYITACNELSAITRASNVSSISFLLKPYSIGELLLNIKAAKSDPNDIYSESLCNSSVYEAIFVPVNYVYHKILKKEIKYVKANGSYATVKLESGKSYEVSVNLKVFEEQLSDSDFVRVSRSYLLNTDCIERINGSKVYVRNEDLQVKISRSKRSEILDRLPILSG